MPTAEWPAWAVWLPGLLTLAVWGLLLSWQASFLVVAAILVIGPLAAGLAIPGWRPGIAVLLWGAFVLSCVWILLLQHVIG